MGYTTEQLETIAARLKAMPPIEKKKQEHSKQDSIKILAKEITSLQKRGYSLDQIAETLRGEGLDITTPTLKSYLQRIKATKSKPKKEQAKAQRDTAQSADNNPMTATASKATFEPRPDSDDI